MPGLSLCLAWCGDCFGPVAGCALGSVDVLVGILTIGLTGLFTVFMKNLSCRLRLVIIFAFLSPIKLFDRWSPITAAAMLGFSRSSVI